MKIIFLASSRFALPSLEAMVAAGYRPTCVVSQPARQKGRGLHPEPTPVTLTSESLGIPVYQPASINSPEAAARLAQDAPELLVVIAYGQILSTKILAIPERMAVNLHASLLPAYRGAAPVNWALIHGQTLTGVSVLKVIREMDAGPLLGQSAVAIDPADTAVTLGEKLSRVGAELLVQVLAQIQAGTYTLTPQPANGVSLAPKLHKEHGLIDWQQPAQVIHNQIRGLQEWPGAYTHYQGQVLKILRSRLHSESPAKAIAGEVIAVGQEGITVATSGGTLLLQEVQRAGGRRMSAAEFVHGHRLCAGERFSGSR